MSWSADVASDRSVLIRLRELIAALNRRKPSADSPRERGVARDAALLKQQAEERIAQLESPAKESV